MFYIFKARRTKPDPNWMCTSLGLHDKLCGCKWANFLNQSLRSISGHLTRASRSWRVSLKIPGSTSHRDSSSGLNCLPRLKSRTWDFWYVMILKLWRHGNPEFLGILRFYGTLGRFSLIFPLDWGIQQFFTHFLPGRRWFCGNRGVPQRDPWWKAWMGQLGKAKNIQKLSKITTYIFSNIVHNYVYIIYYCHFSSIIPVVPHKAVAEVSKIGNL